MALFKRGHAKGGQTQEKELETIEYRSSIGPRTATTNPNRSSTLTRRSGSYGDLTSGLNTLKIYSEMGSATVPIGQSAFFNVA